MRTIQLNGTGLEFYFWAIAFGIDVLFNITILTKRKFAEKH